MPLVPAPLIKLETVNAPDREATGYGGFGLLLSIGVLDSAARMGFLLFLPFLLKAEGASLTTVGWALSLVFIGGAFGKAVCGWLGARLGLLATVVTTEVGTAVAILTVLALPLAPSLALLPLLGVMLNGTSSVLYGTVPELVTTKRIERTFATFLHRHAGIKRAGAAALRAAWGCSGAGLGGRFGSRDGRRGCAVHAPVVTAIGTIRERSGFLKTCDTRQRRAYCSGGPIDFPCSNHCQPFPKSPSETIQELFSGVTRDSFSQ